MWHPWDGHNLIIVNVLFFIIVLSVHIYLLFSEGTHSLLIFLNFIYLAHRNERGEYVFWSGGTFLFSSLLWGTCGGAPEGGAFPLSPQKRSGERARRILIILLFFTCFVQVSKWWMCLRNVFYEVGKCLWLCLVRVCVAMRTLNMLKKSVNVNWFWRSSRAAAPFWVCYWHHLSQSTASMYL